MYFLLVVFPNLFTIMANSVDLTNVPHTAFQIKRPVVREPTTTPCVCFQPPSSALLVGDEVVEISTEESVRQSTTYLQQQKNEHECAICDSVGDEERGGSSCSCSEQDVKDFICEESAQGGSNPTGVAINTKSPSSETLDHDCLPAPVQHKVTITDHSDIEDGRCEGQTPVLSEEDHLPALSQCSNASEDSCSEIFISSMDIDGLIDEEPNEEPADGKMREKRINRKRSRKKEREDQKKIPKTKPPRPNSFIAVQIASSLIRERLKNVQDSMIDHDKRLKKVLTSLQKLHITLMVIKMENDSDIERGRKSLLEAGQLINAELGGAALSMKFDGLSSFGSRVVYAQVSDGLDTLHSIAGIVREVFQKNGFNHADKRKDFNPHATIAKISKGRLRSIPSESYVNFTDTEFGIERVTNIELLSMTEPPGDDGYYYCFERTQFSQ